MTGNRAVIFANGSLPDLEAARNILFPGDVFFAADAGAIHILRLGLLPEVVIGDQDSLPVDVVQKLDAAGVRMVRHPQDKDLTDLELSINFALEEGYRKLLIVAGLGGRLDMTLSNISLLTRPDLLELEVSMDDGVEQVLFVQKKLVLDGQIGDTISLLPWGGPVEIVNTSGLRWPLNRAHLEVFKTRSVSNEMLADQVEIEVGSGLLLCIHQRNHLTEKTQK